MRDANACVWQQCERDRDYIGDSQSIMKKLRKNANEMKSRCKSSTAVNVTQYNGQHIC